MAEVITVYTLVEMDRNGMTIPAQTALTVPYGTRGQRKHVDRLISHGVLSRRAPRAADPTPEPVASAAAPPEEPVEQAQEEPAEQPEPEQPVEESAEQPEAEQPEEPEGSVEEPEAEPEPRPAPKKRTRRSR